jgi:hypothetical protein
MIHDLTEDKRYNTIKLPLRGAHKGGLKVGSCGYNLRYCHARGDFE